MFGKESRKKELINNLGSIFADIQREHQISPGDFPDLARMQEQLQQHVCLLSSTIIIIIIISLEVECLKNGASYGQSYNSTLIWNRT